MSDDRDYLGLRNSPKNPYSAHLAKKLKDQRQGT
jgi:hypothetical protein